MVSTIVAAWPMVALGEAVVPVERPEVPIPGKSYRQVGVRLWGQGAYEREPIDGGATQYKTLSRVEASDIIVNKIWARNGSVSVIMPPLAGAYASGEFPTFAPLQDKLVPEWFRWLTKTRPFWEQCDEKSRGTSGKNRIRPEKFLEITIPLPPLDEQRRIVARIEALAARIEQAMRLRHEAGEVADRIVSALVDHLMRSVPGQSVMLRDILREDSLNGLGARPSDGPEGIPILRISAGTSRSDWLVDESDFKRLEIDEALAAKYALVSGDLLACRFNGNLANVGKISLYGGYSGQKQVYPDKLIRFRVLCERAMPEYVCIAMNSRLMRDIIERLCATTAGNIGISAGSLKTVALPLPSLGDQRQIADQVRGMQDRVRQLQRQQNEAAAELDALLPSVLDRAFRGEL